MVKIAIIEKEMHSHKLSAMADNYPADWCINLHVCSTRHGHYLRWRRYFHLTTTMPKTKRSTLQKAQSAGNLGLLNTGNKENCSPDT